MFANHIYEKVFFYSPYFTLLFLFFLSFLNKNKFIYLFTFGCVGSLLLHAGFLQLWQVGATLHCSVRASHCSGFSCCGAQALGTRASVVVARRLQSTGSVVVARRLWSTGSVVVAHGLSCSVACGIFPDQRLNPFPLQWQVDSHTTREALFYSFRIFFMISVQK